MSAPSDEVMAIEVTGQPEGVVNKLLFIVYIEVPDPEVEVLSNDFIGSTPSLALSPNG